MQFPGRVLAGFSRQNKTRESEEQTAQIRQLDAARLLARPLVGLQRSSSQCVHNPFISVLVFGSVALTSLVIDGCGILERLAR